MLTKGSCCRINYPALRLAHETLDCGEIQCGLPRHLRGRLRRGQRGDQLSVAEERPRRNLAECARADAVGDGGTRLYGRPDRPAAAGAPAIRVPAAVDPLLRRDRTAGPAAQAVSGLLVQGSDPESDQP